MSSSPGLTGRSSTPRLLDSIADVPGILDHPLSRVMTTRHTFALSPNAFFASYSFIPALSELRAQGMPGGRCARGLVCNGSGRAHTSIQVTPESPGIPHAMVYGLCVLSPVLGLFGHRHPRKFPFTNLTPASRCQDHTSSPSASDAVVYDIIRVHRILPRVSDVGQRPSWWDRTERI